MKKCMLFIFLIAALNNFVFSQELIIREYSENDSFCTKVIHAYKSTNDFEISALSYCADAGMASMMDFDVFKTSNFDSVSDFQFRNNEEFNSRKYRTNFNAKGLIDSSLEYLPVPFGVRIFNSKKYSYYKDSVIITITKSNDIEVIKCFYGPNHLRDSLFYKKENDSLIFQYRKLHIEESPYQYSELTFLLREGTYDTISRFDYVLDERFKLIEWYQYFSNTLTLHSPLVLTGKMFFNYNDKQQLIRREVFAPFNNDLDVFFKQDSSNYFYTNANLDSAIMYQVPYITLGLGALEKAGAVNFTYYSDGSLRTRNVTMSPLLQYTKLIEFEYKRKVFDDTLLNNDLLIYPNPTSMGILNIASPNLLTNVVIFDMLGRGYKKKIQNQILDVSDLAKGIYFFTGLIDTKKYTQKFVIQ